MEEYDLDVASWSVCPPGKALQDGGVQYMVAKYALEMSYKTNKYLNDWYHQNKVRNREQMYNAHYEVYERHLLPLVGFNINERYGTVHG